MPKHQYLIGLTTQEARVLRESLDFLPNYAANKPEIKSLLKAVGEVADIPSKITEKDYKNGSHSNCESCSD